MHIVLLFMGDIWWWWKWPLSESLWTFNKSICVGGNIRSPASASVLRAFSYHAMPRYHLIVWILITLPWLSPVICVGIFVGRWPSLIDRWRHCLTSVNSLLKYFYYEVVAQSKQKYLSYLRCKGSLNCDWWSSRWWPKPSCWHCDILHNAEYDAKYLHTLIVTM